jgi:hypothetical protein
MLSAHFDEYRSELALPNALPFSQQLTLATITGPTLLEHIFIHGSLSFHLVTVDSGRTCS